MSPTPADAIASYAVEPPSILDDPSRCAVGSAAGDLTEGCAVDLDRVVSVPPAVAVQSLAAAGLEREALVFLTRHFGLLGSAWLTSWDAFRGQPQRWGIFGIEEGTGVERACAYALACAAASTVARWRSLGPSGFGATAADVAEANADSDLVGSVEAMLRVGDLPAMPGSPASTFPGSGQAETGIEDGWAWLVGALGARSPRSVDALRSMAQDARRRLG